VRFASLCSGIEAPSVAWAPLTWEAAWFSEIASLPCAVLRHRYPNVPNLGDMTKISEAQIEELGPIDLLVAGLPCQSYSVAGERCGMDDSRGALFWDFLRIARAVRPRWVLVENVPGLLSADGGRALGTVLGELAGLGYGWAYRVLDAQYFGLAQRRQRVFFVGFRKDLGLRPVFPRPLGGEAMTLKEALSETADENVTKGKVMVEDSRDSLVFNYTDQLTVGIDLEEMLVINTDDVVLVCPKSSVPKIKKYVESLSTYSDIYTGVLIAAPLLFIVTLAIINLLGGQISGLSVATISTIGAYIVLPVLNVMFILFLNIIQPEV